jgi:hypothetical protein
MRRDYCVQVVDFGEKYKVWRDKKTILNDN